jgi:hypothetical protein
MKCLNQAECAEWLRQQKIEVLSTDNTPHVIGDYEIAFHTPNESYAQQNLARDLIAWIGEFDFALFWITDWPFRKPDEDALISQLRKGHGENNRLIDKPGNLFSFKEKEELVGWVYLMMAFSWDGYLFVSPFRQSMFQTSHENFVQVLGSDKKHFLEIQGKVHESKLNVWRETKLS